MTREIKAELRIKLHVLTPENNHSRTFTILQITEALKEIKITKASGLNGVYSIFLRHLGPRTQLWLTQFFNNLKDSGTLQARFNQTKKPSIQQNILKPGKLAMIPENYSAIALLSICYKLF